MSYAQGRIAELEVENKKLKDEAAEKEKKGEEAKAARKTAEEEKNKSRSAAEEEAQTQAKRIISKSEGEVLNGRRLIEDLQSDNRRTAAG